MSRQPAPVGPLAIALRRLQGGPPRVRLAALAIALVVLLAGLALLMA